MSSFQATAAFAAWMVAAAILGPPARGESASITLEAGTERDPHDFTHATVNFDLVSFSSVYDNGWNWTAFAQNFRAADHGPITWLGEGLIGYRYWRTASFSIYASAGGGERLSPTRDFPFLSGRAGADESISSNFVWNVINLRYRTGVDPHFPYHSSSAGTGLSWQVNDRNEIFARVFAVFSTSNRFAGTGLAIGLKAFV